MKLYREAVEQEDKAQNDVWLSVLMQRRRGAV